MAFYILGAGAMGLVFAAGLARHQIPVNLLLRQAAFNAYKRIGCNVTEERRPPPPAPFVREAFSVDAQVVSNKGCQINHLILATKAQHALEALKSVEGRLGPDSVVVLAQNGVLAVLDQAKSHFAPSSMPKFVYGVLNHGGNRPHGEPFTTAHAVPNGYAWFGTEREGDISSERRAVEILASVPGLNVNWIPTAKETRTIVWKKLLMNCAVNALSGIARCNNGAIPASENAMSIMKAVTEECLKVMGDKVPNETLQSLMDGFSAQMARNQTTRTSMCEDLDQKRRTEISFFNGFISALGRQKGIATPVNDTLTSSILFLEDVLIRDKDVSKWQHRE
ncbi:2-dehydropantoate 2-reductase [Synchytrium endobioticum]|uniref:2-dehydropantoate 2-reductase n=1 Tax=Synchytrium endobioticum TaxID=286115 RepID=A0A507DHV4_9FUNG|nr:2-dehydropantoate 2-reductase [Synchytrium endobioticum]TPX50478.1 2-dehydropantoate 2-reductase [Synchytrium endobioticum]